MTADIEQLRRAADQLTQKRAGAQGRLAAAQARADAARGELEQEFGVGTVAGAREKEAKLLAALDAEADRVRQLLAQAGGA